MTSCHPSELRHQAGSTLRPLMWSCALFPDQSELLELLEGSRISIPTRNAIFAPANCRATLVHAADGVRKGQLSFPGSLGSLFARLPQKAPLPCTSWKPKQGECSNGRKGGATRLKPNLDFSLSCGTDEGRPSGSSIASTIALYILTSFVHGMGVQLRQSACEDGNVSARLQSFATRRWRNAHRVKKRETDLDAFVRGWGLDPWAYEAPHGFCQLKTQVLWALPDQLRDEDRRQTWRSM